MATARITKRSVDGQEAGEKDRYLWDEAIKGFGLKTTPRGTKTFFFEYKDARRRTRRVTIGRYGKLTPDQARDKARSLAANVELGDDPAASIADRREEPTVRELAKVFLAEHVLARRKAKTAVNYIGWLERFILPAIGDLRVTELTPLHVDRLHRNLSDRPTTANRVVAVLSSMMTFAVRRRLVDQNPVRGLERNKETARKRFLSLEEIGRLGEVLDDAERRGESQAGIDCIRLLLLTGMRKGEAQTLRWSFIDFERGWARLPDSKTGAKSVPLGSAAITLLSQIRGRQIENRNVDLRGFVFPGVAGPIVGISKMWLRWRARAELKDVRIHDLRHTFGALGASAGTPLNLLGGILGHRNASTTNRYAHLQPDPQKAIADQISGEMASALNVSDTKNGR